MEDIETRKNYSTLISNVGQLLENARKEAYRQVNSILVKTYWEIGKNIVEFEQEGEKRAKYGSELLNNLSKDLTTEHGKGFDKRNLEYMRKFYLTFPKTNALSSQLSWTQYRTIISLDTELARKFYIIECEKNKWSARELERQINSSLFERIALSTDKIGVLKLAEKGQIIDNPKDIFKDPLVLEFLSLKEEPSYTESQLEQKIIDNLQKFLLELGKGFTFVSRQEKVVIGDKTFYTDLVFYNRLLRCFVILELKIGELKHQDLGQLGLS
jgi:predicted nuclease of restriction endonuclease-like (RecB) superfamily